MTDHSGLHVCGGSDPLSFVCVPTYAGMYRMGGPLGVGFGLPRKPSIFHRLMVRLLLGWTWEDA